MTHIHFKREPELQSVILEFLHRKTGLDKPASFQHETLELQESTKNPEGSETFPFRYIFDQDHFSQYDKMISFSGFVTLFNENIIASSLKLDKVGEAAQYTPPKDLLP